MYESTTRRLRRRTGIRRNRRPRADSLLHAGNDDLFPILYLTSKVERIDGSVLGKTACCIDGLLHPRIAGKPFGMLTVDELQALVPKLEAILRKPKPVKPQRVVQIPIFIRSNQLPS